MLFVGCTSGFFCAALLGKGMYEGVHFAFLASKANEERPDALERDGAGRTLRLMAQWSAVACSLGSFSRARSMAGKDVFKCGLFFEAARMGVWARERGNPFRGIVSFHDGGRVFYRTLFRRGFAGSFVRASCRHSLPVQGTRSRARPSPRPGTRRLKVHGSVPSCGTIAAAGFCRGRRRDGSARERAVFPRFSRP